MADLALIGGLLGEATRGDSGDDLVGPVEHIGLEQEGEPGLNEVVGGQVTLAQLVRILSVLLEPAGGLEVLHQLDGGNRALVIILWAERQRAKSREEGDQLTIQGHTKRTYRWTIVVSCDG